MSIQIILLFVFAIVTGMVRLSYGTVTVKVGVILDLNRTEDLVGLSCVEMAVSDFYAARRNWATRLVVHVRDARSDDVVQAADSALDLVKNVQVRAILAAPETSAQARFMIGLGQKAQVPIISISASSDASNRRIPYFFRFAPKPSSQLKLISAIVKSFGWKEVVPVSIDNDFGNGLIPSLVDALESVNVRVPYRVRIPSSATNDLIVEKLNKLMTMQTRVFIVHMSPDMGARLFAKAEEAGMMTEGYVWIMTDGITTSLNSMDRSALESMQGAIGVKPYVRDTRQVKHFRRRWKRKFYKDHPELMDDVEELNSFGLRAYDATTALAMAVENAAISSSKTDLERLGMFTSGASLVHELSKTRFEGLTGEFLKGQSTTSSYEIVNVNGEGGRRIGFWSSEKDELQLGRVIWPGDTTSTPKGFEIVRTKLRIGVPVQGGFFEFINFVNKTRPIGYCIDVFEAVNKALPYALPFEYVPFVLKPDGESTSRTYNDLVYDVFSGKLDGVVRDITIRANRTKYVDFTLPYTESGVAMLVPMKQNGSMNNAWVFLRPLTWDLWVTTLLFFVFIGFVIWVLEHRINTDFRGPPSHQAGTSFWFSFSTMGFANREKVVSNLTRIVMVIWCFVVLILTQSYTASLTSLLTVQRLQPSITNINDILRKGESVGYLEPSFLLHFLTGLGFHRNKLVPYKSLEECESLFSQGRIAAAFDEVSYMKLVLAKHPSKFTLIDQPYETGGFAFAFARDSPLVGEISRAIVNVTAGEGMSKIQEKWFGSPGSNASTVSPGSEKLGLNSFWSLFLIAGIASVSALLTFAAMFVYEHRNFLLDDSNPSLWGRILNLLKTFDKKDLECHTFRTEIDVANLNINVEQQQQQQHHTPSLEIYDDITSQEADLNINVEQQQQLQHHVSPLEIYDDIASQEENTIVLLPSLACFTGKELLFAIDVSFQIYEAHHFLQ